MMQASKSDFQVLTTSALVKEKLDIEYIAQMSSIEGISPLDNIAQHYISLKEEIERRESAYKIYCTQIRLNSAIHDWLLVIGKRNISQLLPSLAGQSKADLTSNVVSINPRNFFFREIVLKRKTNKNNVLESALFVLGCAIPLSWVKEKFLHLDSILAAPPEDVRYYEVEQKVAERLGTLRFFTDANQEIPMVTKVLVICK